jgi:hypothetical protein
MTREFFLIINPEKINTGARAWLTAKINITDLNKSLGEGYTPAWGFIPPVLPGAIRAPIKSNLYRSEFFLDTKDGVNSPRKGGRNDKSN